MANWHTTNRRALRKLRQKHRSMPHLANFLLESYGLGYFGKLDAVRASTDKVLVDDGFAMPHDPNGGMGTTYRKDMNTMPIYLVDVDADLQQRGYSLNPNAVPIAASLKDTLSQLQVRLFGLAKP